jgi:hypothetical protein
MASASATLSGVEASVESDSMTTGGGGDVAGPRLVGGAIVG